MRLLVCGSRTFTDQGVVTRVLDGFDTNDSIDRLIHGAATGADTCAANWAAALRMQAVEAYPADWEVHEDTPKEAIRTRKDGSRYNAWAGGERNQRMLDEGQPELCVAFIDKPITESRGTKDMRDRCRKAGVKTIVVEVVP